MIGTLTRSSTAPAKPAPNECTTPHKPLTPCVTCGATPPRPDLLTSFSEGKDDARAWYYWYGRNVRYPEPENPTPPDQLREIEAATAAYNAAKSEAGRLSRLYWTAERRGRATAHIRGDGEVVPTKTPAMLIRYQDEADQAFLDMEAAEEAMGAALRELNRVCLPERERKGEKGDTSAGIRARRALRKLLT